MVDATAQMPASPTELRGARVLVAAGNPAVRALIERALTSWDAEAICVPSLQEAVQELNASAYNAVVVDDSAANPESIKLLGPALIQRAARPRAIRVRSFVTLTGAEPSGDSWFDAELTRPLRMMALYAALTGKAADNAAAVAEPHLRTFPPLEGRVLVVEDQELNRDVADGMLKSFGLEVDSAEEGREALAKLAANHYDIVLMDCQMPVMDGYTASRTLRRIEGRSRHTPIVALTADTTSAGRHACYDAGMDDYIGKPFTRATLHAVLSRWIAMKKHTATTNSRDDSVLV
jgi:CheY-like chemotaxis protein